MSHAKVKVSFPAAFKPKKLSEIKDKDERRWAIESASHTLKRAHEIDREIDDIKADPELFDAAKRLLSEELVDTKKALKT